MASTRSSAPTPRYSTPAPSWMRKAARSPRAAACSPCARWARTSPRRVRMPTTRWRRSASTARSAGAISRTGHCTAEAASLPPLRAGEGWVGVLLMLFASRVTPSQPPPASRGRRNLRQRRVHHRLRFLQQALEVRLVLEALGVDLVDRLGAGGARGEPAAGGGGLDAADRGAVAGGLVDHLHDLLAGQRVGLQLVRR